MGGWRGTYNNRNGPFWLKRVLLQNGSISIKILICIYYTRWLEVAKVFTCSIRLQIMLVTSMFMFVSLRDGPFWAKRTRQKPKRALLVMTWTNFYQNNLYLFYLLITSHTSIYLLNSITNNASNINVYVCFTAEPLAVKQTNIDVTSIICGRIGQINTCMTSNQQVE